MLSYTASCLTSVNELRSKACTDLLLNKNKKCPIGMASRGITYWAICLYKIHLDERKL